jgi:hypothetical protein
MDLSRYEGKLVDIRNSADVYLPGVSQAKTELAFDAGCFRAVTSRIAFPQAKQFGRGLDVF